MAWTRKLLDEKQIRKERKIYKENFYGAITCQDTSVKVPYSESMEYNSLISQENMQGYSSTTTA